MIGNEDYDFLPALFLRAPFYSFARYDLERLPEVLADEVFRNALWLASPAFYARLEAKGFAFEHLLDKEKHTLAKYYNRMCFRPVPFGAFASFTLLEWGKGDTVRLAGDEQTRLHLLPDQALLAGALAAGEASGAPLIMNPACYRFGGEFRLIRSLPDNRGKNRYSIGGLEAETFYRRLVAFVKKEPVAAARLGEWIMRELDCPLPEAMAYVDFLVTEQILLEPSRGTVIDQPAVPELPEPVSGEICLPGHVAAFGARMRARWVLPDQGIQPFYAALERPWRSGAPGMDDRAELTAALKLLRQLALPAGLDDLDRFIRDFRGRFELARVPLLEALDPDAGIAYAGLTTGGPEDALQDLSFPPRMAGAVSGEWTALHRTLLRLWRETEQDAYAPLHIREEDLEPGAGMARVPSTCSVLYRKVEEGLLLEHAGGATATSLVGRFTMFSTAVWDMAKALAGIEEAAHPELVFADIAQLSDTHVDNVNRRRRLYTYEIPVNVYSTAASAGQIRLEDLYLSVQDGELILESRRLGKRVIPRLSTAYHYGQHELAVFRLLGDLQYQGLQARFTFDLERLFPGMGFYPRVCAGKVIISCAKWHFQEVELLDLRGADREVPEAVLWRFRKKYRIPQRVTMGVADQQLVFDLANRQEAGFFLACISGLSRVTIREYLLPDRSVKNGNKALAGQYLAFLHHRQPVYAVPARTGLFPPATLVRDFPLGSEWLYLKLYCTPESADVILTGAVSAFLSKERKITQWFFIRYLDSAYHLRLRLRTGRYPAGEFLDALKRELYRAGQQRLVRELQGDTYRRELERYGPNFMELVEGHFCASSALVLGFLEQRAAGNIPFSDWAWGWLTVYALLDTFWGDLSRMKAFCEKRKDHFLSEFRGDKTLRVGMDAKFRAHKGELAALLVVSAGEPWKRSLDPLLEDLLDRTRSIAAVVRLHDEERAERLIADLVHMHLNRIFRGSPREQEMLVYYCLYKYLGSLKRKGIN